MATVSRGSVRRAAGMIVERFELSPPVDVLALLKARVDRLDRVDWPQIDVDAILTGLGADGSEVAVFIRESDNPQRERFTMAHELAHILLPWHLPAPTCSVSEQDDDLDGIEREADLFASCLLVPDRWLAALVRGEEPNMTQVLEKLDEANISTAAALQALRRYLLPGWVFVAYGGNSVVASSGTNFTRQESAWAQLRSLRTECTDHGDAVLNGHTVHWFQLTAAASLPAKSFDDERSAHQILLDAIASAGVTPHDTLRVSQSANGKVGGTLNEAAGRPAAETYAAMRHKLLDWEHVALLDEPDFRLWLAEKSRTIEARGR